LVQAVDRRYLKSSKSLKNMLKWKDRPQAILFRLNQSNRSNDKKKHHDLKGMYIPEGCRGKMEFYGFNVCTVG